MLIVRRVYQAAAWSGRAAACARQDQPPLSHHPAEVTRSNSPIKREAIMRSNIAFKTTDGTTLRGWHYLPAGSGRYPTIVMAHGFSAVKEMYLDKYAEAFMQA